MHRRVSCPIGILRSCLGILARCECIVVGEGGVVLRAVRALGIDAALNARNDVCVGGDKIRVYSACAGAARVRAG